MGFSLIKGKVPLTYSQDELQITKWNHKQIIYIPTCIFFLCSKPMLIKPFSVIFVLLLSPCSVLFPVKD